MENPYRASRKGKIVCALEWAPVLRNGVPDYERAVFLMAYPSVGGKGFVIPISRVALYVNEDGTAKPGLSEVARKAALRLGLDTTVHTINQICDLVMFNVPDLRSMPVAPPKPH